jgi:hypothetical protein
MQATAQQVLDGVLQAIHRANPNAETLPALNPGHRNVFAWPPHAISRDYHVLPTQWNSQSTHVFFGEEFTVTWAESEHGIFGRIEGLFNEAKAESRAQVLEQLSESAQPWFSRMDAITTALGLPSRFHGKIKELESPHLIALLFCTDRDVAYTAVTEIEKRASQVHYLPAFIAILRDQLHPNRRTAQWCVLDMLEDYRAFCKSDSDIQEVVSAIEFLMADSPDDFARTIYKAGVVLGGHFCNDPAAESLIRLITAPSRIARRSAMHAVFHLVEWLPARRQQVVDALRNAASTEQEPLLKEFALSQAHDIAADASDHKAEPVFPEELAG